jgi:hypothetical protein
MTGLDDRDPPGRSAVTGFDHDEATVQSPSKDLFQRQRHPRGGFPRTHRDDPIDPAQVIAAATDPQRLPSERYGAKNRIVGVSRRQTRSDEFLEERVR